MATSALRPQWAAAAALAALLIGRCAEAWQCSTDVALGPVAVASQKGLALDDNSMRGCPWRLPASWPNTGVDGKGAMPIGSLRLFKAWDRNWQERQRLPVWESLRDFVTSNGAKVFIGAPVTCDSKADEQDWTWVKDFIQMLGKDQVMGVAIGNELDILWQKDSTSDACVHSLWHEGRFWSEFQRRVAELDALGLGSVPVTSVFTGNVMFGSAVFQEMAGKALVNSFLTNATKAYAARFVFTFNLYPYFDPNWKLDTGSDDQCETSLQSAMCWNSPSCTVPANVAMARRKAAQLTGNGGSKVWVGETGWSSPKATTLTTAMASCPAWSSPTALQRFYDGFLQWNLAGEGAPDHAFYFAARDSLNFGIVEHFGLIGDCMDQACKLVSANYTVPPLAPPAGQRMAWISVACAVAGALSLATLVAAYVAARARQRREAKARGWLTAQDSVSTCESSTAA